MTPDQLQAWSAKGEEFLQFIDNLRGQIAYWFDVFQGSTEVRNAVPANQLAEFDRLTQFQVQIVSFSDLMQLSVPLGNLMEKSGQLKGIIGLIFSTGASSLWALMQGFSLRGGLDLHLGVRDTHGSPGSTFGPAAINAYELECKEASWPRIIVGGALQAFLDTVSEEPLFSKFARQALNLTGTHGDDKVLVDYLGDGFRTFVRADTVVEWSTFVRQAQEFIQRKRAACNAGDDPSLAKKFRNLESYFESRSNT